MTRDWFHFLDEFAAPATAGAVPIQVPEITESSLILPLDWWVHVGGHLRRALDEKIKLGLQAHTIQKVTIPMSMPPDPILKHVIKEWLDAIDEVRGKMEFVWTDSDDDPLSDQWCRRVFGEPPPPEKRQAFAEQHPERLPPWELWGKYATWSRLSDQFGLPRRFLAVQVLLSPHDEIWERDSLEPGVLMVNPTFEAFAQESPGGLHPLAGLCRNGDSLWQSGIRFAEAAVIDAVRESFRLPQAQLASMAIEQPEDAVERLVEKGFLLRGK